MEFRAGEVIGGRYQVQRRIGSGGMATVYLAHDPQLDRDVAVKVPHINGQQPDGSSDAETVERFQAELRAIGRLSHPNIVTVYDGGQQDGSPYLVMEPVEGENLSELIRREAPLPAERAVGIAHQVAEALAYAHQQKLVHRDIKPQNILLDKSGRAKVTDFGIVKSAEITRTFTGTVLGTASFIAPEVAAGEPATAAADIYGLGVVLYQMLTGHVPFEADNPIAAALRSQREEPRPPSSLTPVPDWLEAVVLKALARVPQQRYPSAREMADDLVAHAPPTGGVGSQESGVENTIRMHAVGPEPTEVRLKAYTRATPERTSPLPTSNSQLPERRRRRLTVAIGLPLIVLLAIIGGLVLALTHAPGQNGSGTPSTKSTPASGQPNLLTNGALLPNGSGPPNGWRVQTFQGQQPRWFYQPGGPRGSQDHEVGLSSSSGTDTAWIGNNVNVQPGWHLTLSGFVKTQGVPADGPGATLQLSCQSSDARSTGQIASSPLRSDTNWTQVQTQMTAPASSATCSPLLRLGDQGKPTSGTAEFSRISLVADAAGSSSPVAALSPVPSGDATARKPQADKKERG